MAKRTIFTPLNIGIGLGAAALITYYVMSKKTDTNAQTSAGTPATGVNNPSPTGVPRGTALGIPTSPISTYHPSESPYGPLHPAVPIPHPIQIPR